MRFVSGSGAGSRAKPINCPTCRGAGQRPHDSKASSRWSVPARACHGAGKVIESPASLRRPGRVRREKTLQVNIPAGVEDGTRIRLAGEGEAGLRGGPPGSLHFPVARPTPVFPARRREHPCRVPIPMSTAALGGTVEVPTIDGSRARLNCRPGPKAATSSASSGKGMASCAARRAATCTSRSTVEHR